MRKKSPHELALYIQSQPNLSDRRVADAAGISPKTIRRYRRRLSALSMTTEQLTHCDRHAIEVVLDRRKLLRSQASLDFDELLQPTHPPGTTLRTLWERYRDDTEDALSYSQFTRRLADHLRQRRAGAVASGKDTRKETDESPATP